MSGLTLPSRPRAIRVVGLSVATPLANAANAQPASDAKADAACQALTRFVRQHPGESLLVLESWLQPTETSGASGETRHVCA